MQIERDNESNEGLILLNSRIPNILLNSVDQYYISLDNGFLNFFFLKGFSKNWNDLWRWVSGGLKTISDTTRIISSNSPYRIHRFFTIPNPFYVSNCYFRNYYRFAIKNMLHYHLSNGVVCYVIFVNPFEYIKKSFLRTSDVVTFINNRNNQTFNFSNLYTGKKNKIVSVLEASQGKNLLTNMYQEIITADFKAALQVFYDQEIYSNIRLKNSSKNFKSIRELTYFIYDGICQGADCARKISFHNSHIDHVIPIRFANNTLSNMNLLCEQCNKYKSDKFFRNSIFQEDQLNFLPPFVKNDVGVLDIFRNSESPHWTKGFDQRPIDIRPFIFS